MSKPNPDLANPVKAVKDWFSKKKVEKNFKKAGPGHKLADAQAGASKSSSGRSLSSGSHSSGGGGARPPVTSDASRAAAEAALKRFEQPAAKPKVAHLDNILAEEKRKCLGEETQKQQMELARKQTEEMQAKYRKIVEDIEDRQMYTCPAMGITQPLQRADLTLALEDTLQREFSDEPLLMAATLLKNCNQSPISDCWATIEKIVGNLLDCEEDQREKFSRIRKAKIETKVLAFKGAEMFLTQCGFTTDADGIWMVFDGDMETLALAREVMQNVEALPLQLDRQLVIRSQAEIAGSQNKSELSELNEDFFKLTVSEVAAEQSLKTETREKEQMLRTKAMREAESTNLYSQYLVKCRFTRLRIKVQSEIVMEATFQSTETPFDVLQFAVSNLPSDQQDNQWNLLFAMRPISDEDLTKSLSHLRFVPNALLILAPK